MLNLPVEIIRNISDNLVAVDNQRLRLVCHHLRNAVSCTRVEPHEKLGEILDFRETMRSPDADWGTDRFTGRHYQLVDRRSLPANLTTAQKNKLAKVPIPDFVTALRKLSTFISNEVGASDCNELHLPSQKAYSIAAAHVHRANAQIGHYFLDRQELSGFIPAMQTWTEAIIAEEKPPARPTQIAIDTQFFVHSDAHDLLFQGPFSTMAGRTLKWAQITEEPQTGRIIGTIFALPLRGFLEAALASGLPPRMAGAFKAKLISTMTHSGDSIDQWMSSEWQYKGYEGLAFKASFLKGVETTLDVQTNEGRVSKKRKRPGK